MSQVGQYKQILDATLEKLGSTREDAVKFADEMVSGSKVPTPEQVADALDITARKGIRNPAYARAILHKRGQWLPPIRQHARVHDLEDPFA